MKKYRLTLKHDNGTVNITTVAKDFATAIHLIMEAEGCPESAITNIKVLK